MKKNNNILVVTGETVEKVNISKKYVFQHAVTEAGYKAKNLALGMLDSIGIGILIVADTLGIIND